MLLPPVAFPLLSSSDPSPFSQTPEPGRVEGTGDSVQLCIQLLVLAMAVVQEGSQQALSRVVFGTWSPVPPYHSIVRRVY